MTHERSQPDVIPLTLFQEQVLAEIEVMYRRCRISRAVKERAMLQVLDDPGTYSSEPFKDSIPDATVAALDAAERGRRL
jgi:hypothetical protein